MYHATVKRIAKKNFERVNQKDFESLPSDCAPNVHHRFGGNHALGGERHDREALRRWLGRLGRLGPGLKLTVHDVWVKDLSHNTIIIVWWSTFGYNPPSDMWFPDGMEVLKSDLCNTKGKKHDNPDCKEYAAGNIGWRNLVSNPLATRVGHTVD